MEKRAWGRTAIYRRILRCLCIFYNLRKGQIRATGFKDTVTLFYDALQIGQVYNISKATIKTANKAYSTIDNDYEMTLDVLSVVEKCDGSVDVPQINYKIGPFADLPLQPANAIIDVLAIVKEIGPIVDLISKSQKPVHLPLTTAPQT